jgi:hypothetical protein
MSELHPPDDTSSQTGPAIPAAEGASSTPAMFANKPAENTGAPLMAWGVAGLVVLVVIAGLLVATRRKPAPPNTVQPLAAYAVNLPVSQLAMSESTSLSGGKSTFIDGRIKNTGGQTVTGITVQVLFANDEGMPPQIETEPLSLIRTRQPYVDTQPVKADPLKPGDEKDFRLIFEAIPENWNSQMPSIHIIEVSAK